MTHTPVTVPASRNQVNRGPVSPATPAGARSRDFHRLTVKRVEPLTDDSAAITLAVPDDLAGAFAFAAGQTPDRPPRRGAAHLLDLRAGRVGPADRRPRGRRRRGLRLARARAQGRRHP